VSGVNGLGKGGKVLFVGGLCLHYRLKGMNSSPAVLESMKGKGKAQPAWECRT
jgi:hypothetical protein